MTPFRRSGRLALRSKGRAGGYGFAVGWHLAWAAGAALMAAALVAGGRLAMSADLVPLAVGAVAALLLTASSF